MSLDLSAPERAVVQRRTLGVLMVSVAVGGAGIGSAFSVGALLAEDIAGSDTLAGAAAAFLPIGAAVATVPLARSMARRGRRPGLRSGYTVAATGAVLALVAAQSRFFPLVFVALAAMGAGSASGLAARYAAADLAPETGRARAIGLLVWATTLGTALGPTLVGVAEWVGQRVGLVEFAGPFLFSVGFFGLAAVNVGVRLRPDPLVVAGGLGDPDIRRPSLGDAARIVTASRPATLAVVAMVISHLAMVGVMTMTPLHMRDGDATLQIIGLVISLHVIGMYAFSPVVGWLTDRLGRYPVIAIGAAIIVVSAWIAGSAGTDDTGGLFLGLFLLGLGWSFGLIGGSTLLVDSVALHDRVTVQGAADLAMTAAGATGGLASGAVVASFGYRDLNLGAGTVAVVLLVAVTAVAVLERRQRAAAG